MHQAQRARRAFIGAWIALTLAKVAVAARLPLFVDEAFYWQEGRHLAWAYSDLPGLTAWLARLGTELGGNRLLALRMPFLAIGAVLPWLLVRIAARAQDDEAAAWKTGLLALLLPLSGTLGLMALPDVPMALATVLCIGAGARLLRGVDAAGLAWLAAGLAIGAFSHYRFAGTIGAGLIALLCLPRGRAVLTDARVWAALAIGAMAWLPLLLWNLHNADAGLRFQLVDRHPWSLQPAGWQFLPVQVLLATPLLFVAMAVAGWRALRPGLAWTPAMRYFGLLGGVSTLGIFVLGFFTDEERVSFHWPLPGYLALLVVVPCVLDTWPRGWRRATSALALAGLLAMLGYYLAVSVPALRQSSADSKFYPRNFAGWAPLAAAVRDELEKLPPGTRIVADDFKLGAELGFALGDADIAVLDHPLNRKHGRAPQLRLWGLEGGSVTGWRLLVLAPDDVRLRELLGRYHAVCRMLGPLPPPLRTVSVDHGATRFLLFALPPARNAGAACVTPGMAWIDQPLPGQRVGRQFVLRGWAFKDGAGLDRVDVTLDGVPLARARYGLPRDVRGYWKESTDPQHPHVGFEADISLPPGLHGRHWLGLRLHGRDGGSEDWGGRSVFVRE